MEILAILLRYEACPFAILFIAVAYHMIIRKIMMSLLELSKEGHPW